MNQNESMDDAVRAVMEQTEVRRQNLEKSDKWSFSLVSGETPLKYFVPARRYDERGFFEEMFNAHDFWDMKIDIGCIKQISRSISKKQTFRGMHYQQGMNKIMKVVKGYATLWAVDVEGDDTQVHRHFLSEKGGYLYAPWWYARGFVTHTDDTEILYFQDQPFEADKSYAVNYRSFPDIADRVDWYRRNGGLLISEKDETAPMFT